MTHLGLLYIAWLGVLNQVAPHSGYLCLWFQSFFYVLRVAPDVYWLSRLLPLPNFIESLKECLEAQAMSFLIQNLGGLEKQEIIFQPCEVLFIL